MADDSGAPEQEAVMLLAIWGSRVPQRAFRSAGFGCSITAARRHAGGVAMTKLAMAVRTAKTKVNWYIIAE
jgi:hypothetical protein